MRILLSYSVAHFDPSTPRERQERWGNSANVISRTLYELLGKHGDVTFVDAFDPPDLAGQRFDLFVGIWPNFRKMLAASGAERSVFVAVNMHPAEHNRLLLDFVVEQQLPSDALTTIDILDAEEIGRAIEAADHVLCFGNVATYNSFVEHGVPKRKVRVVNYGSGSAPPAEDESPPPPAIGGETHILYAASEIGLRKGFDIVRGAATRARLERLNAHLHVVGAASYPHYRRELAALEESLGDRMTNHGWVAAGSDEYRELRRRCQFLLFPSLEEGQAGTVLDAMQHGVIPLISANCGVDFAPLGFCEPAVDSPRNVELLERACAQSGEEIARLRAQTLEYYDEFHKGFETELETALSDFVANQTYPPISVVLPVHDREVGLPRVLGLLDAALVSYGNVDLCVILDGCTDRSAEVVERFFAKHDDYPVEVLPTPDVLEVKTDDIGLRRATGRYAVLLQDDRFVYDRNFLFEAAIFLGKSTRAAMFGGPGGVGAPADRIYQADACMRGPLIFRKSFLEEHGYLDTDISFRAGSLGYTVYCALMDVDDEKNYLWLQRTRVADMPTTQAALRRSGQRARRRYLSARKRWLNTAAPLRAASAVRQRLGV
ncbi:MAG: hypothetical protein QOH76_2104 [Thermoleophilaceae bacterium]|nr:hypothetical protein [Thermoleophilaceae bacterium]